MKTNECIVCGKPNYGHKSGLCTVCRVLLKSQEEIKKESKDGIKC